jgi:hypothetical protein
MEIKKKEEAVQIANGKIIGYPGTFLNVRDTGVTKKHSFSLATDSASFLVKNRQRAGGRRRKRVLPPQTLILRFPVSLISASF